MTPPATRLQLSTETGLCSRASRVGRHRRVAVAAVVLTSACWLALSDIHRYHNADTLIPVLVGLQHWTPYFWGQERLGMLVPLLALPVRHPLFHLVFQYLLFIAGGFGAFYLLTPHVERGTTRVAAGTAAALFFLAALDPVGQSPRYFLLHHEYGVGFSLAGLGWWTIRTAGPERPRREVAGFFFLCLAHWVNVSVSFALVPMILAYRYLAVRRPGIRLSEVFRRDDPDVRAAVASALAFLLQLGMARASGPARYGLLPLREWPTGWGALLWNGVRDFFTARTLPAWAGALGLLAAGLAREAGRKAFPRAARLAIPLFLGAFAYLFFMGIVDHVLFNAANSRYFFPVLLLLTLGAAVLAFEPFVVARPRLATGGTALLLLLLPVTVGVTHGPPRPDRIRAALVTRWGAEAREVDRSGATHLMGGFWDVWPVVYVTTLLRYERGSSVPIYGLTMRGEGARPVWMRMDPATIRIAERKGDPEVPFWRRFYRVPETVCLQEGHRIVLRRLLLPDEKRPERRASAPVPGTGDPHR